MRNLRVGFLAVTMVATFQIAQAGPHEKQVARPAAQNNEAAVCTEQEKEMLRSLPFLAQSTNVHGLVKQAIDAKRLGELGAQGGMLLCYEMGQAMTALRLLKLIKEEDKKKVDDICTQTKLFGSLSSENLMTLKEISERSNQELTRRYFPETLEKK